MENHNWSDIKGSSSAPFINGTLVAQGAHAENYVNIPGLHPSEPNYIWLEAGNNLGVTNDNNPSSNHQSTTSHLTTLLDQAGIGWKEYAEGISGNSCPLSSSGKYAPKHVPFVFFDDVTNTNSTTSQKCIQHIRPYTELADDLASGNVARYNFITPDLCDDMHDTFGCPSLDSTANGDAWLAKELPKIMASSAYKSGGAIFVTWDESEGGDVPIGMLVMSPFAKPGYSNKIKYTHSSTLRTMQTIFGVGPFLRDAANATDLGDLFTSFP
jgi:phospholipase C